MFAVWNVFRNFAHDMTYAVIGTGAIGGFYGARLARSGQEVHFLLHSDYEFVRKNGLAVDSVDGSFRIPSPHAYRSTEDMPKVDCVIVALKTTNNRLLPSLLPPLLRDDTLLLMIQNGIGVEADVQEAFPGQPIAAGLAFICSSKTEPGRVSHQCYGSITLANYSARTIEPLVADFRAAGIQTFEAEYHLARWRKAVWNMPFNGMTVALRTQTDRLLSHPSTEQLIREQMLEVVGAARALGVSALDAAFAEKMIETTRAMTPYSPSMRLDYDFGRPMEIGYLYTRPIAEARRVGYEMPRLEMLEQELSFLDVKAD